MQRPKDTDKCGQKTCRHPFGEHYTTYAGNKAGCSHYVDNQRDGGPCYCEGFAVVHFWPISEQAATSAAQSGSEPTTRARQQRSTVTRRRRGPSLVFGSTRATGPA